MHTTFDHPQFAWPRFNLNLPTILWSNATDWPTYVDADDVSIYNAGIAPACLTWQAQWNEVDLEPDTCEGFVSDGPYSCICATCTMASDEPSPEPSEVRKAPRRFITRIATVWNRLAQ